MHWRQVWTQNVPTAETYDANQDVFRAIVDDFGAVVTIASPGDVRVMGNPDTEHSCSGSKSTYKYKTPYTFFGGIANSRSMERISPSAQ